MTGKEVDPGRRRFLKLGALAGAGLVIGVYFTLGGEKVKSDSEVWEDGAGEAFADAWLRIDPDGMTTIRVNHTEMGQGITTALPMILAEELDADWNMVRVEMAPAESVYKNPAFNTQMTASSTSVRTSWDILRQAGARARLMLIAAAAREWQVVPAECRTESGRVIHDKSGRFLNYGQLAVQASRLPVPGEVKLKNKKDFRIIGQGLPRLDAREKATGRAVFGLDVKLSGTLTAAVVHPPVLGAKLKSLDRRQALAVPGVRRVLAMENVVAVLADTYWNASRGAEALDLEWDPEKKPEMDSRAFSRRWAEMAESEGKVVFEKGKTKEILDKSLRVMEARYESPFQAHATPEPMNCTAHVQKNRCDVWAPTQNQDAAQEAASKITGLGYKDVYIHTTYAGGGFGRRIAVDYVAEAVRLSREVKAPVKVIWSREEDFKNDFYRPAGVNLLRAGLDKNGYPRAWFHRLVGPDHMVRQLPGLIPSMMPYWVPRGARNLAASLADSIIPGKAAGKKAVEGAGPLPYGLENIRVEFVHDDPGVPLGFWRSVAYSQNVFATECFIDEIAADTGRDPFDLRSKMLDGNPEMLKVLQLAAQKAGRVERKDPGIFQGSAICNFHDTRLAAVAEVAFDRSKKLRVKKFVIALDCGQIINPKIIKAQVRGGVVFGLTATLKSCITIDQGRIEQTSYTGFPLLRYNEMPEVEVHLVESGRNPTGIGEAVVPLVAPAVANAVFAASGRRIRTLPLALDKKPE